MIYIKNTLIISLVVCLLVSVIPLRADAAAWKFFGGEIKSIKVCLFPPGIRFLLKEDDQQTKDNASDLQVDLNTPDRFYEAIFIPGLSWPVGPFPPSHSGQYVLGMSLTDITCFTKIRHGRLRNPLDSYLVFLVGAGS